MSTPYTPTPAPLPATLDLPEDGVELLQAETVNTNTAAIADAVVNAQDVAATALAQTLVGSARFYLPAATYANDDFYALTIQESTDFADGFPFIEANSIGGGGNSIRIANTGDRNIGRWRLSIDVSEIDLGGDVVTQVEVYQFNRSASSDPLSGAIVRTWDTVKRTGAGNSASCIGEYSFTVEAGDGDVGLAFRVSAVGGHVISGTSPTLRAQISVEQINRLVP
jgi:hypothetical protein